ncbi:MAG: sugar phosphate isomerase/epimerase [Victivallales bacterium]|nr:sugar phosphate isomerase/epimerase [Victivallales bacterium]
MRATGLLSVTFRSLPFERIIELTVQAGLDGIEWGGDVHLPPGELELAARIGQMTLDAGLVNFSYGSYWRANDDPQMVADTAAALGAQWIRVWAGILPSAECPPDIRKCTVEHLRKLCRCAGDMQVAAEWHCGTLTDEPGSAVRLLDEVGEDNFFCYFQREERRDALRDNLRDLALLPSDRIRAIHVHYCVNRVRKPLANGFEEWTELLSNIPAQVPALLEFVRKDSVEQYLEDAQVLKRLVAQTPGE